MVRRSFTSHKSSFFGNVMSVTVRCRLREYPYMYGISDFWWKIHPNKGCCVAALYIPSSGPCGDVFSLTIFQDSMFVAKLIRVGSSLPKTVDGHCRCLKNIFIAGSVLSGQKYILARIPSTCGTSPKYPISKYNQELSSNGQAPLV